MYKIASQQKKKKSYKKAILSIAIFLFLLISFVGYSYYQAAKTVKNNILELKSEVKNIQSLIATQDFNQARDLLDNVQKNIKVIQKETSKLDIPKILPFTKKEFKAGQNILAASDKLLDSGQNLINIGEEMYEDLGITGKTYQGLDFSKLDSNQKGNVMVAVRQTVPVIEEINNVVISIEKDINILINSPWTKYLDEQTLSKIKMFPEAREFLGLATLGLKYLPELIGYPSQANYLILLQNNTELRPAGGFIGTYGLLQLKDAKIEKLFIDDVYNLDKTVKSTLFVDPPWQLERWNDTSQWFLRDANWSPDFPTSARQAEWFYNQESNQSLDFTGTIALTPDVIADLLKLVGSITTHDITFTAENLIELLEYRVEVEFRKLSIPMSERKVIISDLSKELQERLKNLSSENWLDLANIIKKNLGQKHILLFFNNKDLQKIVEEKGWAGEVRGARGDYLMVIDANIGSLKTDSVMKKSIKYEAQKEKSIISDEYLKAKVTLTYTNNGKFAWNLTRYRTYTRIYVPPGSELIQAEGMMANDRTKEIGEVAIEEEFGKTVFGAFIAIEPKETKTLTFEYKLPDYIKKQLDDQEYSLLVQKQPGTKGHPLKVEVTERVWETDLKADRNFELSN